MDEKHGKKLLHTIIDILKYHTKKEMDDLYSEALVSTLCYYSDDELQKDIIPLALSFTNMEENLTTKRIGAHLLAFISTIIDDKVFYKRKVWGRVA